MSDWTFGAEVSFPTRAEEDDLIARQKLRVAFGSLPRRHVALIADEARNTLDTGAVCVVCGRPWVDGRCSLIATVGCPTCGEPHLAGDCRGQPVASVVCLAPGATIRKPAPLPMHWRDYPPAKLARIFAARQGYHGTARA